MGGAKWKKPSAHSLFIDFDFNFGADLLSGENIIEIGDSTFHFLSSIQHLHCKNMIPVLHKVFISFFLSDFPSFIHRKNSVSYWERKDHIFFISLGKVHYFSADRAFWEVCFSSSFSSLTSCTAYLFLFLADVALLSFIQTFIIYLYLSFILFIIPKRIVHCKYELCFIVGKVSDNVFLPTNK